jgi:hypothetical protein
VTVDGHTLAGVFSASSLHDFNQWDTVTIAGDYGTNGPQTVALNFINDAYDGPGADRNLYVASVSVDGHLYSGTSAVSNTGSLGYSNPSAAVLVTNGTVTYSVSSINPPPSGGTTVPDVPVVNPVVSPTYNATPTLTGSTDPGTTVTVYDGTTQLGTTAATNSGAWSFTPTAGLSGGVHSFTAVATNAAGSSAASNVVTERLTSLVLQVSGDSYNGPPQFTMTVDGHTLAGIFSASALHDFNQWNTVTIAGDYGANGPQTVAVNFVNDAYDGPGADRNLYVASLSIDGHLYSGTSARSNTGSLGYTNPDAAVLVTNGTLTF